MTETTDKLLKDFDKALADYPFMLTVKQVAELLNVSKSTVFRLLDMGQLERVSFKMTGVTKPSIRTPKHSVRELIVSWVSEETL